MNDEPSWITVGELADAFSPDNYAPEPTEALAGRVLRFHTSDGEVFDYRFESPNLLTWSRSGDGAAGSDAPSTTETYYAAELRPRFYFVDHVDSGRRATSVTLLLDLDAGAATILTAQLPDADERSQRFSERIAAGKELTAVSATFEAAAIDGPFTPETPRHDPTGDMVDRRVEYTYSLSERYEHIYLNERFYTWHCLLGSEKGLGDTDRCHYHKLADDLYLFVWREKIVPTLGVVVVDFQAMRTTGKIFGYQGGGLAGDSERVSNFPVGAKARLLNVTER